ITMLEDYVGEDAWRRGVQDYIRTHRLGNTQSQDLWVAVERAAGKPIRAIAHDFTLQPGVPLIRVESATCSRGKTRATLRQSEFTRDRPNKQSLGWRVPVIVSTVGGAEVRSLVTGGSAEITVPGCGPLLVNSGQTGYYRTLYRPADLDRLTASYRQLRPIDQIGLLADTWGLGMAGYQSPADALDMIEAMPANANPTLYARVATILGSIHDSYEGDSARQAAVARYASAKLSPALSRIGWTAKPGEASNVAVLRSDLIRTLGGIGDPAVVAEANRLYAAGDPIVAAGPMRSALLAIVAANVGPAGWDRLRSMAKAERNPLVRAQLYRLLGAARDPALARRALELALTDEPGATTGSAMIGAVAANHPDMAFDFAIENRGKVEALVDASSSSRFLPGLASGSSDRAMIAKLEDFATRHMTAASRRPADRAIASITDRLVVREKRLPEITRWLEARVR
ncbi:MAG: ERAP1-like C-terminal domain-containing protein, partial [Allosphingosinicella sp.]